MENVTPLGPRKQAKDSRKSCERGVPGNFYLARHSYIDTCITHTEMIHIHICMHTVYIRIIINIIYIYTYSMEKVWALQPAILVLGAGSPGYLDLFGGNQGMQNKTQLAQAQGDDLPAGELRGRVLGVQVLCMFFVGGVWG